MELVLGAYTAGMMIAMLTKVEILQYRLTSIGSGFFIPLFFIMSGVELDLPGLVTSPASVARLILFCWGFLFVRLLPVLLYKRVLPQRDLLPLAFFLHHAATCRRGDVFGRANGRHVARECIRPRGRGRRSGRRFSNPRHFAPVEIRRSATRWRRGHCRPPRRPFGRGTVFLV